MFNVFKVATLLVILSFGALYNQNLQAKSTPPDNKKTYGERILELSRYQLQLNGIKQTLLSSQKTRVSNKQAFINLLFLYNRFKDSNLNLAQELLKKVENKQTLTGEDLYLIKKHYRFFHKLNQEMSTYADLYYQENFDFAERLAANPRMEQVSNHLIWLNAHLVMIDHILKFHETLYSKNETLRRIIKNNQQNTVNDPEAKKIFKETHILFQDIAKRTNEKKFKQQVTLVYYSADLVKNNFAEESLETQLVTAIKANPITLAIIKDQFDAKLKLYTQTDSLIEVFNDITSVISGKFGNWAGAIRWREGYLFKNNHILSVLSGKLKPFDVMMEKTPFILTDKLIPGHFGHVAIYLGTPKELQEMNLWNHPSIVPYQKQILQGYNIIEAVRSGVRLTTLPDFLNIDEITVIRKNDVTVDANVQHEIIYRAFDQMGKPYDFNFDISTLDKIVCSELIYMAFGQVLWPTSYRFGRPTFSPDEVAEIMFYKNTKFDLVTSIRALKKDQIYYTNKVHLAPFFDFELRSSDSTPVRDYKDQTNSYWKKTTSCYNLQGQKIQESFGAKLLKLCKTEYKEYQYEEVHR